MTIKPEYGTVEYYEQYFSDVIADAGSNDSGEAQVEDALKILEGFTRAVDGWLHYHRTCATTFEDLREKFLDYRSRSDQEELAREEAELPTITEFPSLLSRNV